MPFKRVISNSSLGSLNVQDAYNETNGVVKLTIGTTKDGNNNHQEEATIENPLDITSTEVMDAATIEIKEWIVKHGTISALESATILQEKMKVLYKLWNYFPGAMSSAKVLQGFKDVVEKRGYTPDNTLFAQSICPDEINHEVGDITDLFTKYCGEVFHMGGLGWYSIYGESRIRCLFSPCPRRWTLCHFVGTSYRYRRER